MNTIQCAATACQSVPWSIKPTDTGMPSDRQQCKVLHCLPSSDGQAHSSHGRILLQNMMYERAALYLAKIPRLLRSKDCY